MEGFKHMSTISQQHDTQVLLACIHAALKHANDAIGTIGGYKLASRHADCGLSNVHTYWMCRNEGLKEPYCGYSGYSAADSYVTDAERELRSVFDMAQTLWNAAL